MYLKLLETLHILIQFKTAVNFIVTNRSTHATMQMNLTTIETILFVCLFCLFYFTGIYLTST